ncbi:MAG: Ig-like domain-containing protein [Clostridia bacterium]|nr:Ig-like domain-containing protein [Clostridia bacterium]
MTNQNKKSKFHVILKTACVMMAALVAVLACGCDLSDIFGSVEGEDEVTISQTTAELKVGETLTLTASSSEGRVISWYSDDEDIAWVEAGDVTAVAEGTTTITATDGKESASCEVTVKSAGAEKPEQGDITLSSSTLRVVEGQWVTITAKVSDGSDIEWYTSDASIATVSATVSQNGRVTGVAAGTVTITAISKTAGSATCTVTVVPVVTISSTSKTVREQEAFKLTATASDHSAITWSTSNQAVATVTQQGLVTGVGVGTATITATSATSGTASCTVKVITQTQTEDGYELVWSDEFNGTSLDMTKWGYQTGTQDNYYGNYGPSYWGNGELQYYTDGANVVVADGSLQITARRQQMGDRPFTSARITTRDKYSVTFGRIEAKMKTPAVQGMWPAFWMLPQPPNHSSSNNEYGGWPANGELDIMEAKGRLQNVVDTTLHFGGPDWNIHDMAGGSTTLSSSTEEWHTYAVEWTSTYIAWIIDGKEATRVQSSRWWTSAASNSGATQSAPFDKPYYILLNLAVGGMYDSYTEPTPDFQQATMYVDYVRVYQKSN